MKAQAPRNAKPAHTAPGRIYPLQDVAAFLKADSTAGAAYDKAVRAVGNAMSAAGAMLASIPKDASRTEVIASLNACPELVAHIAARCKAKGNVQKTKGADGLPLYAAARWYADSGLKSALESRGFTLGMTTADTGKGGTPTFRIPDAARAKGGKNKAANKATKAKAKAAPAEGADTEETASTANVPPVMSAEAHAAALCALSAEELARVLVAAWRADGNAEELARAIMAEAHAEPGADVSVTVTVTEELAAIANAA